MIIDQGIKKQGEKNTKASKIKDKLEKALNHITK